MLFLGFICDEQHSADWLTAFATPYPASRDFLHGKACHWIFFILRQRRHNNPHGLKGRVKLKSL